MARLLFSALAGEDFEEGLVDVMADVGADDTRAAVTQAVANAASSGATHARLPRSHRGGGGSAKGLITLLVLAHLVIVAYWAVMWLRQRRRQRTDGRQRSAVSTPKAVGCTYDWTPTVPQKLPTLPKIPNIQLINLPKAALH
ncbi:hypothetical protein COHA_008126 [Chlorella ohadii]|uniref:Uncharacterized protein n=1 Tax=Chlorella ohadii TaxID=2649997 RepID=A0AAD5H3H4_9CHLO|nr:hypothetical protein COHA_008126 [Chlorella ohadii]